MYVGYVDTKFWKEEGGRVPLLSNPKVENHIYMSKAKPIAPPSCLKTPSSEFMHSTRKIQERSMFFLAFCLPRLVLSQHQQQRQPLCIVQVTPPSSFAGIFRHLLYRLLNIVQYCTRVHPHSLKPQRVNSHHPQSKSHSNGRSTCSASAS